MQFMQRTPGSPSRLAVFPGSFNPVTIAHLELVGAALRRVDEVVLVLPHVFPHKDYAGASFAQRVEMLKTALRGEPGVSLASTEHGLFVEIARECRAVYGEKTRLQFLCGRDAAERIAGWDYGRPGAFAEMLREFDLLVAARQGEYAAPAKFCHAIHTLPLEGNFDHVSASEVRRRIREGEKWESLVPPAIHGSVAAIYRKES